MLHKGSTIKVYVTKMSPRKHKILGGISVKVQDIVGKNLKNFLKKSAIFSENQL